MNNLTKCESCDKHIQPNQIRIYDKTIKPGLQSRQWKCSHCNHDHLIMVMDKTTRRMMNDNKKDRERIRGIPRQAKLLMDAGKLKKERATKNIDEVEKIGKRIDERTKGLDRLSRKLMDEYILSLKVD